MLKRYSAIIVILFGTILTNAQTDTSGYSFFVAGHTYGPPGNNVLGLYAPFKAQFNYLESRNEIKMGFLTGDIVRHPSVESWDSVDADLSRLNIPTNFVVGNHDMYNRAIFESRYGPSYYTFSFKDDLFIVLDANKHGWNIRNPQLQFLKNTLDSNASSNRNIHVFFHQILWRTDNNAFRHAIPNSNEGRQLPLNFWTEAVPLFTSLPNKIYMYAGDLGAPWASSISYDRYRNLNFIGSGMGGTATDNFLIVNTDSSKNVDIEIICINNTSRNCMGDIEDYLVVDSLTNIDEINTQIETFTLYPNPTKDFVDIISHKVISTKIQLFNSQGQILIDKEINTTRKDKLDLRDFPKGIYILRMTNSNIEMVKKIIKR